jgi:hypothetical protein
MTKPLEKPQVKNTFLILNPMLDEIDSKSLQAFYKIWLESNNKISLPSYKYFSSDFAADHKDDLVFFEFNSHTYRFKIVKMGENVVKVVGGTLLGQYWDTIPGSEEAQARMFWAIENKLPYYVGWPQYNWADKSKSHYCSITCPLFDEDDEVDMLVMGMDWYHAKA